MVAPPPPLIISNPQVASLHTAKGVQLYQFTGNDLIEASWSRESSEVSRCKISIPSNIDFGEIPKIVSWLHWVSVWDAPTNELLWRGPVVEPRSNKQSMTLDCRDMMALLEATRCLLGKRWEAEAPEDIAAEMLERMIEHHGINCKPPVVQYDPDGDRFDYTAVADEKMLDQVFEELVHLGLQWTVVAGQPILGPQPRKAITALGEEDFVGGAGIELVQDGSNMFNDVLLRVADAKSYAKCEMGGLRRQKIYNVDALSAVSNADRAARQVARYSSRIRERIELPDDVVLHPEAPITIDQMKPTARVNVEAFGRIVPQELTGIDVTFTPQASAVRPRFAAVNDELPELIELQQQGAISGAAQ